VLSYAAFLVLVDKVTAELGAVIPPETESTTPLPPFGKGVPKATWARFAVFKEDAKNWAAEVAAAPG